MLGQAVTPPVECGTLREGKAMGTWRPITIKTEDGDLIIDALVVAPGLAVDGCGRRDLPRRQRWVITHIPSGLMVGIRNGSGAAFPTRHQAIAVAQRLAELTDWSALAKKDISEALREQIKAILDANV